MGSEGFYPDYPRARVIIGEHVFRAAVARSIASRTQGLSGRGSMAEDEAMLFTFPIAMRYSFWMKDMMFSIDIIWIKDGRVADISENVPVPSAGMSLASLSKSAVKPRMAVTTVLEVNAGLVGKLGIRTGDRIVIE